MKVGIIDYGVGNLGSVANAFKRLGIKSVISSNAVVLSKTDALILPGDGAAKTGMISLKKLGLDLFIKKEVKPLGKTQGKPFLGICLGMQLLMSWSKEGNVKCLDIIPGKVEKLKAKLKIPQIGWNQVRIMNYESRIMNKTKDKSYFYFINSYICKPEDYSIIVGTTEYKETFCSVFEKDNIVGTQFHPEKSGEVGLQMLKNFINLL